MDFLIDFIHVGNGDAIIIWARGWGYADHVFFLDGGNVGNGEKIVDHYNQWIEPHLQHKAVVGFINSHPHEDHIDGLLEVITALTGQISFGIYNDPVECITEEHKQRIYKSYIEDGDADIDHLYKTFEQIEKLNEYCQAHDVQRYNAYAEDINFFDGAFKLLSPTKDFYVNLVQHFTDVDFLKKVDFAHHVGTEVNPVVEAVRPCEIVDASNDTSPENLSSTIIQLTGSQFQKVLLTADTGVETFNYIEEDWDLSNIQLMQLPHHGSRRNISSSWIKKFSPSMFIASAAGDSKHPRRAVINCITRNVAGCRVYSTHTDRQCLSYCTNYGLFPNRDWAAAVPLS